MAILVSTISFFTSPSSVTILYKETLMTSNMHMQELTRDSGHKICFTSFSFRLEMSAVIVIIILYRWNERSKVFHGNRIYELGLIFHNLIFGERKKCKRSSEEGRKSEQRGCGIHAAPPELLWLQQNSSGVTVCSHRPAASRACSEQLQTRNDWERAHQPGSKTHVVRSTVSWVTARLW